MKPLKTGKISVRLSRVLFAETCPVTGGVKSTILLFWSDKNQTHLSLKYL